MFQFSRKMGNSLSAEKQKSHSNDIFSNLCNCSKKILKHRAQKIAFKHKDIHKITGRNTHYLIGLYK